MEEGMQESVPTDEKAREIAALELSLFYKSGIIVDGKEFAEKGIMDKLVEQAKGFIEEGEKTDPA